MVDHLRTDPALAALEMVLTSRRPALSLIHLPDHGCQYAATGYPQGLGGHGIAPSISRAGNRSDNALADRFVATFKRELIAPQPWQTRRASRQAIIERLEVFSDQPRHSAID